MAEPSFPPYNVGDLAAGARRTAPAALRNAEPIAEVLAEWLPACGIVLEVASGTGQHAHAFATRFPGLDWQPSDRDDPALASIVAWVDDGPANLRPPLRIDAAAPEWPVGAADAILSINMVHISPWGSALGLLDGAARLLPSAAPLILYGPWFEQDVTPAPSNLAFDADLKARDPRWGIRTVERFAAEAAARHLALVERRAMPANNHMLLLRKR